MSTKADEDGFLEAKERRKRGSQGQLAQGLAQTALLTLKKAKPDFDYDRLYDTRSCGRPLPQQVADFLLFYRGKSFALEVKEVSYGYRLAKSDFPQFERMIARNRTGCQGVLLVYFKESELWSVSLVEQMSKEAKSWLLVPEFTKPEQAILSFI